MENTENLIENPENLYKEYLKVQKELDITNQNLYDCKRQLRTAEALEKEYQSEIEHLQTNVNTGKEQLQARIIQLEDEIVTIRTSYCKHIDSLEEELLNKEKQIKELHKEVDAAKDSVAAVDASDEEKILDELLKCKEQNAILLEDIDKLREALEEYQRQSNTQQDKLQTLGCELERLNESVNLKKAELSEANELIQTLQDELLCVKNELDSLNSKPLEEKSKGNSLFSEVDDRRVQLQSTVNSMKLKYHEMKRERGEHLKLIAHLRNENIMLCKKWESEIVEKADDQIMVEDSYKRRIKTLEELVEKYKKDLSEKSSLLSGSSSSDDMKFFDFMLNTKKKEIEELRQKIATLAVSETTLSMQLAETKQELRKSKLISTQQEGEIHKLKAQNLEKASENRIRGLEAVTVPKMKDVAENKNYSSNEKCEAEIYVLKSCLKTNALRNEPLEQPKQVSPNITNALIVLDENVEETNGNCSYQNVTVNRGSHLLDTRRVQFSEITVEPIENNAPLMTKAVSIKTAPDVRTSCISNKLTKRNEVVCNKENTDRVVNDRRKMF